MHDVIGPSQERERLRTQQSVCVRDDAYIELFALAHYCSSLRRSGTNRTGAMSRVCRLPDTSF